MKPIPCDRGNQPLAYLLQEAPLLEATSFGHGRADRRHDADPAVGALDHRRVTLERKAI